MRDGVRDLAKELIKKFEGLELDPYICPAGRKTIGWGHAILFKDKINGPINLERAEELLQEDYEIALKAVVGKLNGIGLKDHQLAALVSFTFNLGEVRYAGSTLLKKVLAKDFEGAAGEFKKWVYATVDGKKKVLKGLVSRREAEAKMFLGEE